MFTMNTGFNPQFYTSQCVSFHFDLFRAKNID